MTGRYGCILSHRSVRAVHQEIAVCVSVLFAWCAQPAGAVPPASTHQIFCESNGDMLGVVEGVESHDCRLEYSSCEPKGLLFIKIRVKEVIRDQNSGIREGDVVSTDISVRNDPPKLSSGRETRFSTEDIGMMDFPLTGEAITDFEASSALVGQQVFISLHGNPRGTRNWSRAWRFDQGERLRQIWSSVCQMQAPR